MNAPPPPVAPRDPLEAAVDRFAVETAAGARLDGKYYKGFEAEDRPLDFTVPLSAGRCYLFAAVATAGVRAMSIYLWDPGDSRIDQMRNVPRPTLAHCPKHTGPYHLQIKFTRGGGSVVVGSYLKP
jgi:hypothetical protein